VMRNMASRYHRQEWVMNDDSYDIDKVSWRPGVHMEYYGVQGLKQW
jgi:hypothetical protein